MISTKVQEKINRMREFARVSGVKAQPEQKTSTQNNDGLLKAIRTPEDAAKFMAELEALILYERSKRQ